MQEVYETIGPLYKEEKLKCPNTPQEWREKAEQFGQRWTYHDAVGSLDTCGQIWGVMGRVLMSRSECQLKQSILDETIGFPDPLPRDDKDTPYFIVADHAFSLRTWLTKPVSGRNLNNEEHIFNYKLSRARRVEENGFGIPADHFRCLLTTITQELHNVTSVVLACVTLHHIIWAHYRADHQGLPDKDNDQREIPGAWRQCAGLADLGGQDRGNYATVAAKTQSLLETFLQ